MIIVSPKRRCESEQANVFLTRWKGLYCIGLDEDLGHKRCVAVINFFLEFQLRPGYILGVVESVRLRVTAGAGTLVHRSIV